MPTQVETTTGSKAKLIEAAIDLISSKGFEGTGINDILEMANVTRSNFYYHFKSKEELALAALDCMMNYFYDNVIAPTFGNKALDPKARFEAYFNCAYKIMENQCCNRGCPFVNLAMETSDFYPSFREKINGFFRRYTNAIKLTIEEGVQQGVFRSDLDPQMVAQFVLAGINGTMVMSKSLKTTEIIEQNAKTLFQLILKSP